MVERVEEYPLWEGDKRSSFRWFVMAMLFGIIFISYMDRSVISFTLEILKVKFHFSDIQIGLILGSFGLTYIFTIFFGGIWVDNYGPKAILATAVILWSLSMLSMAAAIGIYMMIASRLLLGFSEGPVFPTKYKVGADWIPINQRATALTYAGMAVPLALLAGSYIVPYLLYSVGWRGTFIVFGLLSLLAWVPIWLYYFTNRPEESEKVTQDELAIINNGKGNFLVREGNDDISKTMWSYMLVSPTFKTETILAKDKPLPANPWRFLLTNKTLLASYWACFVYGYFLFFFMGWLPSYFNQLYNIQLRENGWFNMLPWGLAVIFMVINARISDYVLKKTGKFRHARSYQIILGVLLSTVSIAPLAIINHPNLVLSVIAIAFSIAFITGVGTSYYLTSLDLAKRKAGTAVGINGLGMAIAGFIAPIITGYFIDLTGNFKMGFMLLAILGFSSAIVVFLFHKPDDPIPAPAEDSDGFDEHPYAEFLKGIKKGVAKLEQMKAEQAAKRKAEALKKAEKLGLKIVGDHPEKENNKPKKK